MEKISKIHKQFLLDILAKVKFQDYKFKYDALSFPTSKQVKQVKAGTATHKLRVDIIHYGPNSDVGKEKEYDWLTYCGCVVINQWNEQAIVEAIYITLIQKFRHEASEIFKFDNKILFHEHRKENIAIPK